MTRGFLSDDAVRKSDLIDIAAELIGETDKAFHVDDGDHRVWLPKSQVERDGQTFTLPEWLAKEKGLI
jgi:hypothetical protein